MRKIYICGDSFACRDPDSNITPWIDLLSQHLGKDYSVINLSIVCASNFLIRLQADRAIKDQADFIILFCTSSTRGQGRLKPTSINSDILDRFYRIGNTDNHDKDLACYSVHSIDETCVFDHHQMELIQQYHRDVHDLEISIMENRFIIESTLFRLRESKIPFVWDQGGFENPNFGGPKNQNYFPEFRDWRSDKNIWDLAGRTKSHRPYFHIINPQVHQELSEYYYSKICCELGNDSI